MQRTSETENTPGANPTSRKRSLKDLGQLQLSIDNRAELGGRLRVVKDK